MQDINFESQTQTQCTVKPLVMPLTTDKDIAVVHDKMHSLYDCLM